MLIAGFFEDVRGGFNLGLFALGGTSITAGSVLALMLMVTMTWWASRMLQNVLERTLKRRGM